MSPHLPTREPQRSVAVTETRRSPDRWFRNEAHLTGPIINVATHTHTHKHTHTHTLMHTFFTMEGGDSEFAIFTLPTLKAFLEARRQNVSGNKQ